MVISIYPAIEGGVRELRAEAGLAASGPFDSPQVIAGRLLALPSLADLTAFRAGEVLYEGEAYRFDPLNSDGSFELHKAWYSI
jgi:hypothetical protein